MILAMLIDIKKQNKKTAFTLLEIIFGIAIFSAAAISVGYMVFDSSSATDANNKKINTILLARECLEASRSIRDIGGFASLSIGDNQGMEFDSINNTWSFQVSPDVSDDGIYTRSVSVSLRDSHTKVVTCTVSATSYTRVISTTLIGWFTDWRN